MEIPSIPNTGRIVDYWLGGEHHFPPDTEGGKLFDSVYPHFPTVFRAERGFVGRATRYIASQGIDQFLVFGAGIPTQGNVHEVVPQARVLYSDIDPINIELGKQILASHPQADYTCCDVTNLDTLDQAVVTQVLGSIHRLGIVFTGVAAFLSDEALVKLFDTLYDRVPQRSFFAMDFDGEASARTPRLLELLNSMSAPLYMRNPATIQPLLGRWQLTATGIQPVAAWQAEPAAKPIEMSEPVFHYGCVVYKS